jgi:hypothetical protein
LLSIAFETHSVNRSERGDFRRWRGVMARNVGDASAIHHAPTAADCGAVLDLRGCSICARFDPCGPAGDNRAFRPA